MHMYTLIHAEGHTMRTTQGAGLKFKPTLQWIKYLLGWMLLVLFFMSIGWFIVYLLKSAY